MKDVIACCAYCERTAEEVVADAAHNRLAAPSAEEALQYVQMGQSRVLLCPDDRGDRPVLTEAEQWELLTGPVDLPPGITRLSHCCPMLEYDGFRGDEATFEVELRLEGTYMVGNCPECGMQVRSAVLKHRELGR